MDGRSWALGVALGVCEGVAVGVREGRGLGVRERVARSLSRRVRSEGEGRRILWRGGWLLGRAWKGLGLALEGCSGREVEEEEGREGREVEEDAPEWKNNLACCVARCGV